MNGSQSSLILIFRFLVTEPDFQVSGMHPLRWTARVFCGLAVGVLWGMWANAQHATSLELFGDDMD